MQTTGTRASVPRPVNEGDYLAATDLLPSLCHSNTWKSKDFRSPCLFQPTEPRTVSKLDLCRWSATLAGLSPTALMLSSSTCVAAKAVSWKAPEGLRFLSLKDRKSTRLNSSHLVISYAVF